MNGNENCVTQRETIPLTAKVQFSIFQLIAFVLTWCQMNYLCYGSSCFNGKPLINSHMLLTQRQTTTVQSLGIEGSKSLELAGTRTNAEEVKIGFI